MTERIEDSANLGPDCRLLRVTFRGSSSGADIALGYKQLLEVERGWRDMK